MAVRKHNRLVNTFLALLMFWLILGDINVLLSNRDPAAEARESGRIFIEDDIPTTAEKVWLHSTILNFCGSLMFIFTWRALGLGRRSVSTEPEEATSAK